MFNSKTMLLLKEIQYIYKIETSSFNNSNPSKSILVEHYDLCIILTTDFKNDLHLFDENQQYVTYFMIMQYI